VLGVALALVAFVAFGSAAGTGAGPATDAAAAATRAREAERARQAAEARAEDLSRRYDEAFAINRAADAMREDWQRSYRDLLERIVEARTALDAAHAAWLRGRHRRHLRGAAKAEALATLEADQKEVDALYEELADFRERARRAGVAPGWLAEVEEDFPSLAAAISER